jgi:hypothetical protein
MKLGGRQGVKRNFDAALREFFPKHRNIEIIEVGVASRQE